MGCELGRERLPLPHQPGHLLFGLLALACDGTGALTVRVQRRISQRAAETGQALLQRMDLALDLIEPPPELANFATYARFRPRASHGRRIHRGRARRGGFPGGGCLRRSYLGCQVVIIVTEVGDRRPSATSMIFVATRLMK